MIFSSYRFIFVFFPIVFAGFCLLRLTKKAVFPKVWLVLSSLAFYAVGQPKFFFLLFGTVIFNYLISYLIGLFDEHRYIRVSLLLVAIAENIGLLVYFKYTNFIIENLNRILPCDIPFISVALPLGISFFTFQILAYTVSIFKREAKCVKFLDYCLFITFFPQLVVGPVVLHNEILPQIEGDEVFSFERSDIMRGILLFSIGAAKKVILANPLINYASAYYAGNIFAQGTGAAWLGMASFTFAYYFDFSGYIDMARGLGYLFGIKLPINFDSPYKAVDFADFWRRWNMTISRFFDTTVFRNLFGFGDRIPKLIFATIVTFLVSGIWHGAAWHFIFWGLVNGALVAFSNILVLYRVKIPRLPAQIVTFVIMMLVRVLFDAECMTDAFNVYKMLFSFGETLPSLLAFAKENIYTIAIIFVSAIICFCFKNSNDICAENKPMTARHSVAAAALLVLALVNMSQVSTFLYFNF